MKPRPPLSAIIIYAIGQYGWSLASFGAGMLLVFFYMPPEDSSEILFPSYFYQGAVLVVFTIVGLLGSLSRIFDAITDPIIAGISDRMKITDFGKRKKMMAIASFPFALTAFLIFFPPLAYESWINVLWLIVISIIYYISFTAYLIPYNALIAELGHHKDDRMKISTTISLTWILGFATGFSVYSLMGVFTAKGYSNAQALQILMAIYCSIAFVCMLVPVFFLNETKYAVQEESEIREDSIKRFIKILKNDRNFRIFVWSDMIYWLAAQFISLGIGYYIVTLMNKDKGEASAFLGIAMIVSLLFYWPINILVKKIGKKKVTIIAFAIYCVVFSLTGFIDLLPFSIDSIFYIAAFLAAFPIASFGIIPNAIVADLIYQKELEQGEGESSLAGIYYAVRTFMMKIGITVANLIFPSLLLLGKSIDNPLGVRATAVAACIFCILGMIVFSRYNDVSSEQ